MEKLESLLERTLLARGRSSATVRAYRECLRRFARFLARPLRRATLGDLRAYQRHLAADRRVAFSCFNQNVSALRFLYRECLDRDWGFSRLPFQRKPHALPEILGPAEVRALLAACPNLKHRTAIMTAYGFGLRLAEVLALRPEHVDAQRMVIRVEHGKGRRDRYVTLPRRLLGVLRKYRRAYRPTTWLFEGEVEGRPLSPKTLQTVFLRARRRAGIAKKVGTIQALLGHASPASTQIYTHLARTYLEDATSPLDRLYRRRG